MNFNLAKKTAKVIRESFDFKLGSDVSGEYPFFDNYKVAIRNGIIVTLYEKDK